MVFSGYMPSSGIAGSCGNSIFSLAFFLYKFIYLFYLFCFWLRWVFVAVWAFSSCGEQGLLSLAVCGLLIAVASLVVEHRP